MKKLLLSLLTVLSLLIPASQAYAQSTIIQGCDATTRESEVCKDLNRTDNPLLGPKGIITSAVKIMGVLTGVASIFYIIISGLRYITSGGDPAKTKSAREGIIYSAIGLGVAMVAGIIVQFLLSQVK
jgi:cytochrome bd-type quinol oxidase subunit 2